MTSVSERPARLQWNITRGDDVTLTLTFVDSNSAAINLTGRTYAGSVLTQSFAAAQTISVSTAQAATGVLVLTMSDTITTALTEPGYLWKLVETNGATTTTLLDGPMSVGTGGAAGVGSGSSSATVTITTASATVTCTAQSTSDFAAQAINAQTGTTYTLAATDVGALVTQSNGSAITTTVPQDSAVAFAIGAWCELYQLGAGQITVVAGSGATLNKTPTAKARAQYSRLFVQKISANTWALSGDLAIS